MYNNLSTANVLTPVIIGMIAFLSHRRFSNVQTSSGLWDPVTESSLTKRGANPLPDDCQAFCFRHVVARVQTLTICP